MPGTQKTDECKLLDKGYTSEEVKQILGYDSEVISLFRDNSYDKDLYNLFLEKYFIYDNLERYLVFKDTNKSMSADKVIALVNTNRDKKFYEDALETDTSLNELMLVNKYYKLSEQYNDKEMVNVSSKYAYDNNKVYQSVLDAFIKMYNDALKEDITLIMRVSYRSYEAQQKGWMTRKISKGEENADNYTARAGHSEHQTGYAIDIDQYNYKGEDFSQAPASTWLENNAYKYGFILRYPKDKEDITGFGYEPWHYRYVGLDIAQKIYEESITFDEYYAYYIANK